MIECCAFQYFKNKQNKRKTNTTQICFLSHNKVNQASAALIILLQQAGDLIVFSGN